MNELIDFIVTRRKALGKSQRELTRDAGLKSGTLANIELGRVTKAPSFDTMEKLAYGLRVSVSDLEAILRGDRSKTRKPWSHHDLGQTSGSEASDNNDIAGVTNGKISGFPIGKTSRDAVQPNTEGRQPSGIIVVGGQELIPLDRSRMRALPVFEIACGEPIMIETPLSHGSWPVEIAGDADAAMIVRGESMIGCGIGPGDNLFVQLLDGEPPQVDDIVIANVNGDGCTCKVFKRDAKGTPFLESMPGDGSDVWRIAVTPEVRIVAVVIVAAKNMRRGAR